MPLEKRYTEADITTAISAVEMGVSIRQAGRDQGIPEATLRHRIHGREDHQTGAQRLQKLSPVQENELAKWALVQEALGVMVTYR